jgi:hypothetical protein
VCWCRFLIAWLIATLAIASGSCPRQGEPATDSESSAPLADIFMPDPTAPLGIDGEKVPDATSAGLPFIPLVATSAEPASQWVLRGRDGAANAAAFVYASADWGTVTLMETLHTGTNEDVLAWEATLQDSGCSPVPVPDSDFVGQSCSFDPFRRVKLNSGIVALLSERGGLTSLSWVEPPHESGGIAIDPDLNLYVDIYGSTQLSGEEAIQLADSLAGATSERSLDFS